MKIQAPTREPSFKAGLTKQIRQEIASCDVEKISREFAKHKIPTDFKGNKLVAWCSLKTFQACRALKLPTPNGIFIENFDKLNTSNNGTLGITNLLPTTGLYVDSDKFVPEATIFFNEFDKVDADIAFDSWDQLDEIADCCHMVDRAPTDFFMNVFFHEFSHVIHANNLLDHIGTNSFIRIMDKLQTPEFQESFHTKYGNYLGEICSYAKKNFLESIACDLSKRFCDNINKNNLSIEDNFIKNSPYKKRSIRELVFGIKKDENLESILRNFWFGKID